MNPSQVLDNCIKLAADDISQLRRCDVFRVLEAADDCAVLAEAVAFIEKARPDLAEEVAECREEIATGAAGGCQV